ncbi:hypothetical protein GGQ74_002631 [Desulfobaculum xiamenense]|uniref:Glycosyltransferase 2-like domain-containing protein n=1 Tax=Desulfobaculum xiamenense TaxID=995050 RepID=A0A846QP42_9BACT|nr:glycosyltransferase family 2 protein [Desulfobaculum xiamenense]NJB68937.1 hypothetical protein [Desulfobaculum xiamenense]
MSMSDHSVSVIIPVRDNPTETAECLDALRATAADAAMDVIVVDNGSREDNVRACRERLVTLFPGSSTFVALGRNANFGPACNIGAKNARSDLLFFLNNDTIPEDGWLAPLIGAFDHDNGVGAVGPLLLYPGTRTVQHLGIAIHPGGGPEHLYSHIPGDHPLCQVRRPLQALTAAALMIPRALFEDIGGFHEEYRNGFEDMELCCRIRQRGLNLRVMPGSVILHIGGRTEGRFDNELHNGMLLANRCDDCFRPDFHTLIARDGFEMRLTSALDPYPALPATRSTELMREYGESSMSALLDVLQRKIFWEEGYELAIGRLESSGDLDAALCVRLTQLLFMPHGKNASALAELATRLGQTDIAQAAAATRDEIAAREADATALRQTARALSTLYERMEDQRNAALYANWITANLGCATASAP